MSTALTQQRAVEIAAECGAAIYKGCLSIISDELHAAMEQYLREASARCQDCGERNPASIHTCSPQKPASVEPFVYVVIDGYSPNYCAATSTECHEHINDAINEYGLVEASKWRVVPAFPRQPDADALRKRVEELEDLVADQLGTIRALMAGSPEDTTTPVIVRIGKLEAEVERRKATEKFLRSERPMARRLTELEAEVERLRKAG